MLLTLLKLEGIVVIMIHRYLDGLENVINTIKFHHRIGGSHSKHGSRRAFLRLSF